MSRKDDLIQDFQGLAAKEKTGYLKVGTSIGDSGDRMLISLEKDVEVREWAASLGCSEHDLREAVKVVGHSADEVKRYLSYQAMTSPLRRAFSCPEAPPRLRTGARLSQHSTERRQRSGAPNHLPLQFVSPAVRIAVTVQRAPTPFDGLSGQVLIAEFLWLDHCSGLNIDSPQSSNDRTPTIKES